MSGNWKLLYLWVPLVAAGCGPSAEELAGTMVAQTQAAVTNTPVPTSTSTSTETPLPSATPTDKPTPTPGPFVYQDEFASDSSNWICDQCEWKEGSLFMGPYPISGAYVQHVAICEPCGLVRNYRMAVDVAYGEGPSERGFGLLVRLTEEIMMTFEITPWQTAILWKLPFEDNFWEFINGFFSGRVRAGLATNHIEVVSNEGTRTGKVDLALNVNGRTVFVAYNQPGEIGAVGLTVFGHAMSAVFDNFEFEELAPYTREKIPASGPPGQYGRGDGVGEN